MRSQRFIRLHGLYQKISQKYLEGGTDSGGGTFESFEAVSSPQSHQVATERTHIPPISNAQQLQKLDQRTIGSILRWYLEQIKVPLPPPRKHTRRLPHHSR